MADPKKNCRIDDCPFTIPSTSTKNEEETEIKTVDLCNDPICSNVHEKKLVDMSQGLSQLENILKNMTGLCREPKCPSKSPDVEKKIQESIIPLPQPNRYPAEPLYPAKDDSDSKPQKDTLEFKTCKGTVCYNAYMGYKMEPTVKETEPQTCGSQSCIPKPKTPKPVCGSPTCPFNAKKDATSTDYGLSCLQPESDKPKTSMGPCGGFSCPSQKTDLFSTTYKPQTKNIFDFDTTFATTFPTTSTFNNPCNFDTCPLGKQPENQSQVPVGLCGRTSCPYASLDYAQRLEDLRPNTPVNFNAGSIGGKPTSPCGEPSCPYGSQKPATTAPCGNVSCPYGSQNTGPPKVGICGRTSCPFASITPNVQARTTAPCGNPCCNFGKTTYDPVGLCGQTECPMLSKTSPGAVKPCPFADKMKRYPCGSPSCPHVNPSGMLQTHEYTYDKSFVQEAARPYCGSASPYDYMSSLQPSYPSPYATNYPLFSYTEPPSPVYPCPYLPKKTKKSCGKPTCPYANGKRQQKDNFCIESTCPWGEGICGGPRKFSCESPSVDHCESPDCKVPGKKNGKQKCCYCGGSLPDESDTTCCGSKKKKEKKRKPTCCRMRQVPDIEENEEEEEEEGEEKVCCKPKKQIRICKVTRKPPEECGNNSLPPQPERKKRMSNATTRSLVSGLAFDDPVYAGIYDDVIPGDEKESASQGDPGKCSSKTCPYLKKLVFCDDCGGVLPDADTPSSTTSTHDDIGEGTVGSITEEMEGDGSGELVKELSAKKILEEFATPAKEIKEVVVKDEDEKPQKQQAVSLYEYPGVQIGHRDCSYRRRKIPRNMGWLWNIVPSFGNPELWRGYKPGAICKTVYKMMKEHRRKLGLIDPNEKKKKSRRMKIEDLKHCIEVKKVEGDYTITVNPVKDPKTRDPMDNPYMDVTPIQFKVEKEKKEKEPAYCPCDEESDQPTRASSEFEFHFTPPAAIPETIPRRKKEMAEAVCQYDCMDLPVEIRKSCKSFGGGGKKKGGGGKKGKKGKKK